MAQLLTLESMDPDRDISIYINSPGRLVHRADGDLRHDAVRQAGHPDDLPGPGGLGGGRRCWRPARPGKRFALPNSRILIHQPSTEGGGQASDIEIQAREILRMRELLEEMLAKHTGRTLEQVAARHRARQDPDRRGGHGVRPRRPGAHHPGRLSDRPAGRLRPGRGATRPSEAAQARNSGADGPAGVPSRHVRPGHRRPVESESAEGEASAWHASVTAVTCSSAPSAERARSRSRSSSPAPASTSATSASTSATRSSRRSSPRAPTSSGTSCPSRARSTSSSTSTSSARTRPRRRSRSPSTTTTSGSRPARPASPAATTTSSWPSRTSC